MTYPKKIAEQVMRLYEADNPNADSRLDPREVYLLIYQAINRLIKAAHFNENLPGGERVPPNAIIAKYTAAVADLVTSGSSESCSKYGVFGQDPATYLTRDESNWTNEEWEAWITANNTADVTVSRSGSVYTIKVDRLAYPFDKPASHMQDFLRDGNDNTYFKLTNAFWNADENSGWITAIGNLWVNSSGQYWTTSETYNESPDGYTNLLPDTFCWKGMSNISAVDDQFQFDYDVNAIHTLPCQELIDKCLNTLDLLQAITDGQAKSYDEAYFVNMDKCEVYCSDDGGTSKATLPAQPIHLPRGMGVWRVGDPADPFSSYIPVQSGRMPIAQGVGHTNLDGMLGGLTAYTWQTQKEVVFNKPASAMPSNVELELLVVDPAQLGETDMLPIPADMEDEVINMVLQKLQPQRKADETTDQNTERG